MPAVRSLFSLLNTSGSGMLTSFELLPFATFTRITSPDVHWEETYRNTWKWLGNQEAGLSCHAFAFLLRMSELGCYCANEAVVEALLDAFRISLREHPSSRVGEVYPLLAPMPIAPTPLIFQPHNALLA
jgi:hypothetical protein